MTIRRFDEQNQFLNPYFTMPVYFDGRAYPSVGHAFAAAQALRETDRAKISQMTTAREVIAFTNTSKFLIPWTAGEMLDVMYELLEQKFSLSSLREQLIATGDQELIYGNSPDTFWGIDERTKKGANWLGKLLMRLRGTYGQYLYAP